MEAAEKRQKDFMEREVKVQLREDAVAKKEKALKEWENRLIMLGVESAEVESHTEIQYEEMQSILQDYTWE